MRHRKIDGPLDNYESFQPFDSGPPEGDVDVSGCSSAGVEAKTPEGQANLLSDFDVEFYDYDCGRPCTPNGCSGHLTDIPLSFTVGGVIFHVDGAQSGDFPDSKENTQRVCNVVKALGELITASVSDANHESTHE